MLGPLLTCLLISAKTVQSSRFNESARESSSAGIWLVIIMCIMFCFAMRHANDFYWGETVTLVKEGEWTSKFRRRQNKNARLVHIERDFYEMFQQLREAQESENESEGCSYYEEPKPKFGRKPKAEDPASE